MFPAIRDDLGITNTQAGIIGAVNVGTYLIGTLFVAWAANRYLLINVMRLGLVMATAGLMLASVANSALDLAMALLVAGLGGAFVWIPAPVIASNALPFPQRSLAVGLVSSGIGLGIVFASILSGALRSLEGDQAWSNVYQVQFYIALLILTCTIFIVRHEQAQPKGRGGFGGFNALQRMSGWASLISSYSIFGFMYYLVIGFLTTRLEDDSAWQTGDAATAFTSMGIAMIFGGPIFVALAQRIGVRLALSSAYGLWPIFVCIVLSGLYLPTLAACVGLGLLFSGLPTLITLYVVQNTTTEDYGPTFAAATLAFGVFQTISPAIGGFIADVSGSFTVVFLLSSIMGFIGLTSSLKLPTSRY